MIKRTGQKPPPRNQLLCLIEVIPYHHVRIYAERKVHSRERIVTTGMKRQEPEARYRIKISVMFDLVVSAIAYLRAYIGFSPPARFEAFWVALRSLWRGWTGAVTSSKVETDVSPGIAPVPAVLAACAPGPSVGQLTKRSARLSAE